MTKQRTRCFPKHADVVLTTPLQNANCAANWRILLRRLAAVVSAPVVCGTGLQALH